MKIKTYRYLTIALMVIGVVISAATLGVALL